MSPRDQWTRETIGLEAELTQIAESMGVTVLELARQRRETSDSPIRCGQLD